MRGAADPRGYYQVMGVGRTASPEDIRNAFRERAKLYHPDQGGERADEEQFRLLREAYEVLRDPRKRMQYDADGLERERADDSWDDPFAYGGGHAYTNGRGAGSGSSRRRRRFSRSRGFGGLARDDAARLAGIGFVVAVLALVVVAAFLWSSRRQLEERDILLADLYQRLNDAVEQEADVRAQLDGESYLWLDRALAGDEASLIWQASLPFAQGQSVLDPALEAELDAAVEEIAVMTGDIPPGQAWVLLLEGRAGKAASGDGVAIDDWETALLRLASTVDYVVGEGLPGDQLSVRFQAGLTPESVLEEERASVVLKLLCCLP